jgi:Flp pilus assembly protein TadG
MRYSRNKRQNEKSRLGAATVEFAVVLPLFLLSIIMPMIEFSRALIVTSCIASAAQVGCRVAVLPGSTNASVDTAVSNSLSAMRISNPNALVIKVNGGNKGLSEAVQGDDISVTVSVPYKNTSWLPSSILQFFGNATVSSTQVMRRE